MSLYCPNKKSKEWQQLRDAVGEDAAYQLWDKNNGNPLDKAPNGAESNLFKDLLRIYHGNEQEAIIAKAKVYSPQFLTWFGDWTSTDSTDVSKCVDENGEPRVMWHGGARGVREFRPGGDTTGDGYYIDPRNQKKIPNDSVHAMFFSTSMPVGLSYAQLTGVNYYNDLRTKFDSILASSSSEMFSAEKDYFKNVDEIIDTVEKLAEYEPRLKKAAEYMRNTIASGKKISDNKKVTAELYKILRNISKLVRDDQRAMQWVMGASSIIKSAERAISFVDEYNTPEGRAKLLEGEIPAFIKKEWAVYKQRESNRAKVGKDRISNYDTLVFYSDMTLGRNIGYDGKGLFIGEGDYITDMSDAKLAQTLFEIKQHAQFDIQDQKAREDFQKTMSKSQLYPVYINMRNPLTYDYEGTAQGQGFKESQKVPFGFVAATQVDKALQDGNDGVIYKNLYDPYFADNYGIFNPNNVKSVKNEGPFSTTSNDQYYHLEPDSSALDKLILRYIGEKKLNKKDKWGRYFLTPRVKGDHQRYIIEELRRLANNAIYDTYASEGKRSPQSRRYLKFSSTARYHEGDERLHDSIDKDVQRCADIATVMSEMQEIFPQLQYTFVDLDNMPGVRKAAVSFVRNGVVHFVIGKDITKDVIYEECLHPLITAMMQDNPELFAKLHAQAKKEFNKLYQEIERKYQDAFGFTAEDRANELVTQALARYVRIEKKNPKHSLKSILDMFTEWLNGILKRINIRYNSRNKAELTAKELPTTLTMESLARIINTKDVEFKLQIQNRTQYHLNSSYNGVENTKVLQKLLNKQYARMKRQRKEVGGEYRAQDRLFKLKTEITAKINEESVARAAKYCIEVLGMPNQIDGRTKTTDYSRRDAYNPQNLLDSLYAASLNNYADVTPQDLYNMYNDHIAFIQKMYNLFPQSDKAYTPEIQTDLDIIKASLEQTLNAWDEAAYVVGDRIVDELVDKYVNESEDRKDILKENMKDELHKNIITSDIGQKGVLGFFDRLKNYAYSSSDVIKGIFHDIQNAEQRTREQTLVEQRELIKAYKKCRTIFGGNWQRKLMEVDENGVPTGYFVRPIDYGKFRREKEAFEEALDQDFLDWYGYTYKKDENGDMVNTSTGEYAEEETWQKDPSGNWIEPPYVEYQRMKAEWLGQHAHRRYTSRYYTERLSVPFVQGETTGHGLSPKTLARYNRIQSQINYFLERCTHDDGIAYIEELDQEQLNVLDDWQSEMDELANPYNKDGSPKSAEDQQCALEIQSWQKWLNQQLESEVDVDAFMERLNKLVDDQRVAAKWYNLANNILGLTSLGVSYDDAIQTIDITKEYGISDTEARELYNNQDLVQEKLDAATRVLDKANHTITAFAKYNSQMQINPKFLKQTLGMFDTNYLDVDPVHREALLRQTSLRKLIPYKKEGRKDSIEPDLSPFERSPQFFYEMHEAEQAVSDHDGSDVYHPDLVDPISGDPISYKEVHDKNFAYAPVLYVNERGQWQDVNGNDTTDKNQAITELAYLRKNYTDEILRTARLNGGVGTLYNLKDKSGNPVQIDLRGLSNSDMQNKAEVFVDSLLYIKYVSKGKVLTRPMSVFTYRVPLEQTDSHGKPTNKKGHFTVLDVYGNPVLDDNGNPVEEQLVLHSGKGRYVERKDKDVLNPLIDDQYDKTKSESVQPDAGLYTNDAYKKIENNPKLKVLYDLLTSKVEEIIKNIRPDIGTYDYRLPQIEGELSQIISRFRFGDRGLSLKNIYDYAKERLLGIQARDFQMRDSSEIGRNPDYTPNSSIPDRYIRRLKDPSVISSNIVGSVMMMIEMKNNYRNKESVLAKAHVLLANLSLYHRNENKLAGEGTYKTLLDLITTHLLDMKDQGSFNPKTEEQQKHQVMRQKMVSYGRRWAQLGMLAGNMMSTAVGFSDSLTTQLKDALIAKYYTVRDWLFGLSHALINIPAFIINMGNPIPNCKLVALMKLNGISTSLSSSAMDLYKSRGYKMFKGAVKVGAGAGLGYAANAVLGWAGVDGWMGGQLGLMCAGGAMGLFGAFDYFTNSILLAANYHHIRFYKGGNGVEPGFYTKRELQLAFRNAGVNKNAGWYRIWHCGKTLWDAYKFRNGEVYIKPEFEPYVTDQMKTQIMTNTKHRAALTNGMAPDNDRPWYTNTVAGKIFLALRNYMAQVLQHKFAGGHSFQKKEYTEESGVFNGVYNDKARKVIEPDKVANRNNYGAFNWETGEMQDQQALAACHGIKTLCLKAKAFLTGKRNASGYKFSNVEWYALKEVAASIVILLGVMFCTTRLRQSAIENVTPTVGSQWNPNDWVDNGIHRMVLLNWAFRTGESLWTREDVTQMYDLISTASTLASGVDNYLRPVSMVKDIIQDKDLNEEMKTGGYKGETRLNQHLYTTFILPGQLHKTNSFYGCLNNYSYYQNKFGLMYKLLGYDMSLSTDDFKKGDDGYGSGGYDLSGYDLGGYDLSGYDISGY